MRATAFITLLAVLALVAAGCGGGSKKSMTPLELVSQAVSKTTGTSSEKFQMTVTETAGPIGPVTITGSGATDNSTHSAQMTMDLSSIASLAGGKSGGSPSDWQANVVIDGSNANDVVMYMSLPALTHAIPGSKPWVKLDLNQLGKLRGVNFSQLFQSAGNDDPSQALQMIQQVGSVQQVGQTGATQIDGVATTQYSGTIDPQKVAAKLSGAGLGASLKQLGTKPIPVDVWVDGNGYVRKLDESMSMQSPQAGTIDMKMTMTMSDFGTTVSITPPPADQTTDFTQLIKSKK